DYPDDAESRGRPQRPRPRDRFVHSFLRNVKRTVSLPKTRRLANPRRLRARLARLAVSFHLFVPAARGAAPRGSHREWARAFHRARSLSRSGPPMVGQRGRLESLPRSVDRRSHRQLSGVALCRQPEERQSLSSRVARTLSPAPRRETPWSGTARLRHWRSRS